MSLTAFNRRRRLDAEEAASPPPPPSVAPERPPLEVVELDDGPEWPPPEAVERDDASLDEMSRAELLSVARSFRGRGRWATMKTETLRERLRELERSAAQELEEA